MRRRRAGAAENSSRRPGARPGLAVLLGAAFVLTAARAQAEIAGEWGL